LQRNRSDLALFQ